MARRNVEGSSGQEAKSPFEHHIHRNSRIAPAPSRPHSSKQPSSSSNLNRRPSTLTMVPTGMAGPSVESNDPNTQPFKPNGESGKSTSSSTTCLQHLDLGDVGSPLDMLEYDLPIEHSNWAFLQKHDFAFILRSNGKWTYAIIAERLEDSIIAVVNTRGATKSLCKRRWAGSLRLTNSQGNRNKLRQYFLEVPQNCEADSPGIKSEEWNDITASKYPASSDPGTRRESVVSLLSLFD